MKNLRYLSIAILLLTMSSFAEADTHEKYEVGINDVLDIRVLDHPELQVTVIISADGTITFPYIGSLYVNGMNLTEIEKTIVEKLSEGYVKYPVVTVSLVRSTSKKIYSYGETVQKGELQYQEGLTLEIAMSMVGGVTPNGMFGKLILRRKGEKDNYRNVIETKLNNGLLQEFRDFKLEPDDILLVERSLTFLIQGEMASRGRFELEKDMTVGRALLQAGGVTSSGRFGRLIIRRKEAGQKNYSKIAKSDIVDGVIKDKDTEGLLLAADDIIIVERTKTFLVEGEVANRGRFELESDTTVLKALLQAGGVSRDGEYGSLTIRRRTSDDGYEVVARSKIVEGVIEDKNVENFMLMPDDVLSVERNKTFFIYGEINQTGEFVLKNEMTVFKAITIAGGLTKWGSESKIKILRQHGDENSAFKTIKVDINDVIDGNAKADVYLMPGDIIIVSGSIL